MLLLVVCTLVSGCAYTSVARQPRLFVKAGPQESLVEPPFSLHCGGVLYAFMLSPIVPLPPVIPGFGSLGTGDAWILFDKKRTPLNGLSMIELIGPGDISGSSAFGKSLHRA